jgi:hypothetical protein
MIKVELDDDFNDFGFSAVSEEELKTLEKQLLEEVSQKSEAIIQIEKSYKDKLTRLYHSVMPLLKNLEKNPEKDYIFWPDRATKMKSFIAKIEKIMND